LLLEVEPDDSAKNKGPVVSGGAFVDFMQLVLSRLQHEKTERPHVLESLRLVRGWGSESHGHSL